MKRSAFVLPWALGFLKAEFLTDLLDKYVQREKRKIENVFLLQGVFFPNSGILADQGVAGKGVPIGGIDALSSGTPNQTTSPLIPFD